MVGRDAELVFIRRLVDAASSGCGRALVTGEAGIGKSRLLREAAGRARKSAVFSRERLGRRGRGHYRPVAPALLGRLMLVDADPKGSALTWSARAECPWPPSGNRQEHHRDGRRRERIRRVAATTPAPTRRAATPTTPRRTRITLDLDAYRYERLRIFALEHRAPAAEVLRALRRRRWLKIRVVRALFRGSRPSCVVPGQAWRRSPTSATPVARLLKRSAWIRSETPVLAAKSDRS